MRIGIIGKGNVGTALAAGLTRAGHEVRFGHRDPKEPVRDAAKWGNAIVLAVPYGAVSDAARAIASGADGKPLVDVTNAIGEGMGLAIGCTTSAAEELQKMLPRAHVVKAFNTVFAQNQASGRLGDEQLTAFVAGDHAQSKAIVMKLAADIGFESVDVGPLKSARYLEPMGIMLIGLGYGQKLGTGIGFRLARQ